MRINLKWIEGFCLLFVFDIDLILIAEFQLHTAGLHQAIVSIY